MATPTFQQYDVVRILEFGDGANVGPSEFDERPPIVGDVAAIVEVYTDPPGYELECCDLERNGATVWLRSFGLGEVKLELVWR